MFSEIKKINEVYGMRAALREADFLNLDVQYNQNTFCLDCFINGKVIISFRAN